jgi:hypothetical protein
MNKVMKQKKIKRSKIIFESYDEADYYRGSVTGIVTNKQLEVNHYLFSR